MTYFPGALGQFALGQGSEDAGNSYILTVPTGAFALAGQDATITTTGTLLPSGKVLLAGAGAFALSGQPVNFHLSSIKMVVATGVFVLTGNASQGVMPSQLTITDGFRLTSTVTATWNLGFSDHASIGGSMASTYLGIVVAADQINLHPTILTRSKYNNLVREAVQMFASNASILPMTLNDEIIMTATTKEVLALLIVERLTMRDVYAVMAKYHLSVAEMARIASKTGLYLGGLLHDGIAMSSQSVYSYYTPAMIHERVIISELFGHGLFISVTCEEGITLADDQVLQTIYHSHVNEGVFIDVAYIEPSGSYTTWAINTRNNHVTEYQNYVFNSFAKHGTKYIGANEDGIYELLGDTDAGEPIPTVMRGGMFQPGGGKLTSFKSIYLGMAIKTGSPGVFLKLVTGDGSEYVYTVNPMDRMTARVQVGKGLRSRYYAYELMTSGADFDLDDIQFIPLISKRRFS